MEKVGKLSVILFEDRIDAVVRSLGETGVVQFVNLRDRLHTGKLPLLPYEVSPETRTRCSDTLSKIDASIKVLNLKPNRRSLKTILGKDARIEDVLAEAEARLADLPIESLAKSSALLERINELTQLYEVKVEDSSAEEPGVQGPPEEILEKVERELSRELLTKLPPVLTRIDELAEKLNLETRDVVVEKEALERLEEENLAEIEDEISEVEKIAAASGLGDRKALTGGAVPVTLEERAEVGGRLIELRAPLTATRMAMAEKLSRSKTLADFLKQSVAARLTEKLPVYRSLVKAARSSIEADRRPEDILEDLIILENTVKRESKVAEAKEMLGKSSKMVYLETWTPQRNLEQVKETIRKMTDEYCVMAEEAVAHGEPQPVILKPAPTFIRAFEKLTFASGYPSAHEVNPTRLMAITFPILFGIMFADVGQGAIFVALGVALTYLKRRVNMEEVGDIARYLLLASEMFILLGLLAMFWGFIFGEFFGPSELLHPIKLGKIGPFYIGGYEPMQEPMKMIRFAIMIGAIHVSLGLVLKIVNTLREHELKHVPIPISWLWLLWGGLFMWAWWGGISSITKWFADGLIMMIGLIITPLILLIIFTGIVEGITEGIGFGVEVFAETLSHTLSYGRLMALSLVHSVMNYLFLVLGGVKHGHFPISSIPIVATGTILVMIVEGLIVFVHTLRLHWIEWFSKFYSGEGIPFKPFKLT